MQHAVAVIGSGIAGLSAAWLLARRHGVTLIEQDDRIGGHSNTVDAALLDGQCAVDTGFIVYNTGCYPNLIALFDQLEVPTSRTNMSFAVSLERGGYEYSGTGLHGLFGQPSNALRPAHWRLAADILRFFRDARDLDRAAGEIGGSLGQWLAERHYSRAFIDRHILPMGAAIWSMPASQVLEFPAAAFARFFANHGLLQVRNRPEWRTVRGGSREYVRRLLDDAQLDVVKGRGAVRIDRGEDGVDVRLTDGSSRRFDRVVLATHADQALGLLGDPTTDERRVLGAFRYSTNHAVLHCDASHMPRRRRLWSSWNFLGGQPDEAVAVSYWMNRLQPLSTTQDVFVTLNPGHEVSPQFVLGRFDYTHPIFDTAAIAAQRELWRLQGARRIWFAGSYAGYGFHEDAIQSGLAAAEALGGVRRPWTVEQESGRIHLGPPRDLDLVQVAA